MECLANNDHRSASVWKIEGKYGEEEEIRATVAEIPCHAYGQGRDVEEIEALLKQYFKSGTGSTADMISVGSLEDLFAFRIGTTGEKLELFREDGYPKSMLVDIMSDIAYKVSQLRDAGITHWNIRPCCFSIFISPDQWNDTVVTFSEKYYKEALESLDSPGCEDIFIALANVLSFCVTGGVTIDLPPTKYLKTSSGSRAAMEHLTSLNSIPEASDLIQKLLNPSAHKNSFEILDHPLFWWDRVKFKFMCRASLMVIAMGGPMMESFAKVASDALYSSKDESKQNDVVKVKSILADLAKEEYVCHYKTTLLGELEYEVKQRRYYVDMYPRFSFELYKVVREHNLPFITEFCFDKECGTL